MERPYSQEAMHSLSITADDVALTYRRRLPATALSAILAGRIQSLLGTKAAYKKKLSLKSQKL
jgi:hypothetical protein